MVEKLSVTILGCGSSGGVPRIDGDWGDCDPSEIKNLRSRCSLLVQKFNTKNEVTTVLIDTSPDIRNQLLKANVSSMDAVLYTHDHADQCGGIDDLRVFALRKRKRVQVYLDEQTASRLIPRFSYCFNTFEDKVYPAILEKNTIKPYESFVIDGPGGKIEFIPFLQKHGKIDSLGFKFNNIAYSSDVVDFYDESFQLLNNLDYWIVDALRYDPHPTHAHLNKTLGWIKDLNTDKGILTNLHIDLDYKKLKNSLPNNIQPAYDNLNFEILL